MIADQLILQIIIQVTATKSYLRLIREPKIPKKKKRSIAKSISWRIIGTL